MFFIGKYVHSIDNKGRTIIPKNFRKVLGDSFVMVKVILKSQKTYIRIYTEEEWLVEFEKIENDSEALKSLAGAVYEEDEIRAAETFLGQIDSQGRCIIDAELREFAGLKDDIIFVGRTKTAEIWDVASYKEFTSPSTQV